MDATTDTLFGPYPINKTNGYVTVPKELLAEIGVERGEKVHWMLNPRMPGTAILIPATKVSRIMPEVIAALERDGG